MFKVFVTLSLLCVVAVNAQNPGFGGSQASASSFGGQVGGGNLGFYPNRGDNFGGGFPNKANYIGGYPRGGHVGGRLRDIKGAFIPGGGYGPGFGVGRNDYGGGFGGGNYYGQV